MPPGSFPYVIGPGDTLFRLAQTYGTTVSAIIPESRHRDPTICRSGRPSASPARARWYARRVFPHLIQPGDTLSRLARRYSTTVPAILAINPGIGPANLRLGQAVCLPEVLACPAGPSIPSGRAARISCLTMNPRLRPSESTPGRRIRLPTRQVQV